MRTLLLSTAILIAALLLPVVQAGPITLTQGDALYVGRVEPGTPSNPDAQTDYINYLITMAAGAAPVLDAVGNNDLDRLGSTHAGPFDTASSVGSVKQDNGNTFYPSGGFQYIYGKYGGLSLVWYDADGFFDINGQDMGVILPAKATQVDGSVSGLSHTEGHNPVNSIPDGGATLTLLGLALLGISRLRRIL